MTQKALRAERADGVRARETILTAAARLATIEGLEGLSIGRLADHIGMSKSGLYAHFGSKEELQLATIEKAWVIFNEFVVEPALTIEDPLSRLDRLAHLFLEHLRQRVFPGGCFFAATAAELAPREGAVRARVVEVQAAWSAMFVQLLGAAQAEHSLNPDEDIVQLAFELDSFLLMAHLSFQLLNDTSTLDRASVAFRTRLARARSQ